MTTRSWARDVADLVLGRCCLVCTAPGPSLCRMCEQALRGRPTTLDLDPLVAASSVRLTYALPYRPIGGPLVLAYKERGDRSLGEPLGRILGEAIAAAAAESNGPAAVTVVPIPGHTRPRRGFDALGALTRAACRDLLKHGLNAEAVPLLHHRHDHAPQKGLRRTERWAAVRRSMQVDERAMDRLGPAPMIVVDDVVTTGATLLEAVRALTTSGLATPVTAAITHRARAQRQ